MAYIIFPQKLFPGEMFVQKFQQLHSSSVLLQHHSTNNLAGQLKAMPVAGALDLRPVIISKMR